MLGARRSEEGGWGVGVVGFELAPQLGPFRNHQDQLGRCNHVDPGPWMMDPPKGVVLG